MVGFSLWKKKLFILNLKVIAASVAQAHLHQNG
jgi:hypothetical protein